MLFRTALFSCCTATCSRVLLAMVVVGIDVVRRRARYGGIDSMLWEKFQVDYEEWRCDLGALTAGDSVGDFLDGHMSCSFHVRVGTECRCRGKRVQLHAKFMCGSPLG